MSEPAPRPATAGLRAVLEERAFSRYLLARFAAAIAVQMQTVAVGIQVYSLTHDPLDLGLVGLSQFLPFIVCVLPAGHLADRRDRRAIVLGCLAVLASGALALTALALAGLRTPRPVFAVLVGFGIARAFMAPASNALVPNLVPREKFRSAVALNSSAWQLATILGPALGGTLYALAGAPLVYGLVALLLGASVLGLTQVPARAAGAAPVGTSWRHVIEGIAFVWRRKSVLGAISMDLFAVLFGGATALMPAYAADVLKIGAAGIGWLRAAPGVGAALMAIALSLRPIHRRAGPAMMGGVALFGAATIVFGLSTEFWLSLGALAVLGAADMVSVFVRQVLIQLETPDAMRGRVGAVNSMFIGASNELGEFESGVTAAWWGLKPAVVIGGLATLGVAALWTRLFPALARLDRFEGG